jgi:putative acetyltransferase
MKTLVTDRLLLRPFEESDLQDFFEYAKSPNVGPNAGWPPHSNIEESRDILEAFMDNEEVWALVLKENNKLIGSIGLHKDQLRSATDVKMLGYVLSEVYWGQGIMYEAAQAAIQYAFEYQDIVLLTVHHYSYNNRSKRVIDKCGFQYEGTLRHCSKIYNGSVYDLDCYSMTKEEWQMKQ